jgi:very-short-patch-repair endonuclease
MNIELARERITQLYQFFKAVENRRTPKICDFEKYTWVLGLDFLPIHNKINFIKPSPENGEWLTINKPTNHPCPDYPQVLNDWLDFGWDDPINEFAPKISNRVIQRGNDYVDIKFEASEERVKAYSEWSIKRSLWRTIEFPAREVAKIWDKFFSLHNDLMRDGEKWELMIGDGIVSYKFGNQNLFHPLVLKKVELVFNSSALEFKLLDTDSRPELYTPLFADDQFAGLPIKNWQASLEFENLHPLDDEKLNHYLRGMAGMIKNGEFNLKKSLKESNHFQISRNCILFLRERPTGKSEFIDKIITEIPKIENFPSSLLAIVGLFPSDDSSEGYQTADAYANEQEDVLLTKPANSEQVEILRKLSKRDSVLVQGPPGTGKTHTIANLIGNFLSEGKSVLVTSHTTKALRVLRGQVAEPLRSLCVSLLDSDAQSRSERETAIRELATRLSDNPQIYRTNSVRLRERRIDILKDLKKTRFDLLKIVGSEYVPIILAGNEIEPSQAAKEVAKGIGLHDWIPGPVDDVAAIPLSNDEVRQLYEINHRISALDDDELSDILPKLDLLPDVHTFSLWVSDFNELNQSDINYRRDLWSIPSGELSSLEDLYLTLSSEITYIEKIQGSDWKLAVLQAGIDLGTNIKIWKLLCENIQKVRQQAQSAAESIFEHGPSLATNFSLDDQLQILIKINQKFEEHGGISWFKIKIYGWTNLIDEWRIGSNSPKTADEFLALRKLAELTIARNMLIERWNRLMSPLGEMRLESLDVAPEDYAYQFVYPINSLLQWHQEKWRPIEDLLIQQGLKWSTLLSEVPPSNSTYHIAERLVYAVQKILPEVLYSEEKRRKFFRLEVKFQEISSLLQNTLVQRKKTSMVTNALISAVRSRSELAYKPAWLRLKFLTLIRPDFIQRLSLINRLKILAPLWTNILENRLEHDVPPLSEIDADTAWRWLQLQQELKRRTETPIEEVQLKIHNLNKLLQEITIELVENLAWAGLLEKVTNEQRQSLLGWSAIVKRIGAGTGKLVPSLLRQAQIEMENAHGAVPVWIMPFGQVTRSFHPIRDQFDVIIIDEASQEDILGLVPLFMAKKVIVVGDDEQVTPLDVGGIQEPIQNLINQWLSDMPSPNLFDLKTSVYDRAQIAFGSVIRLKEHFRCVPEIIQFSNALCYNYTIKPLRESASTNLKPPLVAHRVEGFSNGKTNVIEAEEIVNLIQACLELPEYENKSFGVITMVGDKQSDLINEKLRNSLDPIVYDQRRILCGNPAQFQGDERDVIFLSLVDSKNDSEGPLALRQDGADGLYKKRFNVASSRAKDQLWVVHSLDIHTHLKPTDIRRRLIEHAHDPSNLMQTLDIGLSKTESPFEAEVFKILSAKGYKVSPQWQVGAYRIDMVIESEGKRLAVECDGERWHYNKAEEDLDRQALLERLGWIFVRIRGSVFYRDNSFGRSNALKPLFEKLKELGIEPNISVNINGVSIEGNNLIERIKRKALEFKNKNVLYISENNNS